MNKTKHYHIIPIPSDREEWLSLRRNGIGGSDAAALLGLNPYRTPYELWAEKQGFLPAKEDTECMRQGRDLEQYVACRFMEQTGMKVRSVPHMYQSVKYPFMQATIDRIVVGRKEGLECKTTSILQDKALSKGEIPLPYYCQCMHYLAVTGFDCWHLAVLVLNRGFYVFRIERDEKEIQCLIEQEQSFWETYILGNAIPPTQGLASETTAILSQYKGNMQLEATPLFEHDQTAERYLELGKRIDELSAEREQLKQQIMLSMGESTQGLLTNGTISWKPQERRTIDTKRLKQDHPKLYEQYSTITISRPFKLTINKEDV